MADINYANQIGLNIWGLRGGHNSFCSSGIDVEDEKIKGTWKDIRGFVYVSNLTVRFYALEFTQKYKVFTLYRPENDTDRTGAYVATTLYVPHDIRIENILNLLREISDAYHKDHYDGFGNPNTNPEYLQPYLDIIKNHEGDIRKEGINRTWNKSKQDDTPRLLPFSEIGVVERFFATPYRNEFTECQEVMFWDVNQIQNLDKFGIHFQKDEVLVNAFKTDGVGIHDQFEGGHIKNLEAVNNIVKFERNGETVDVKQVGSVSFFDETEVSVEMKRKYHQNYVYSGPMIGVSSPFVKRGQDYEFRAVSFTPRMYKVQVEVSRIAKDSDDFELLYAGKSFTVSNGRGCFDMLGNSVESLYKLELPLGETKCELCRKKISDLFAENSDSDPGIWKVEGLKVICFEFGNDISGNVKINGGRGESFSTREGVLRYVVPENYSENNFKFEVQGYDVTVSSDFGGRYKVKLKRNVVDVRLQIPDDLKPYLGMGKFSFGNQSCDADFVIRNIPEKELSSLKLKYEILHYCEFNKVGVEYNDPKANDVYIFIPKLNLVQNGTGQSLKISCDGRTYEISERTELSVVPACYTFGNKIRDQYDIKEQQKDEYHYYVVSEKVQVNKEKPKEETRKPNSGQSQSVTGHKEDEQSQQTDVVTASNTYGTERKPENAMRIGMYYFGENNIWIDSNNGKEVETNSNYYEVRIGNDGKPSSDGKPCIFYFDRKQTNKDKQGNKDEENKGNGFVVKARATDSYSVELYKEGQPNVDKLERNFFAKHKKLFLWIALAVIIVALVGGAVWFILKSLNAEPESKLYYAFDDVEVTMAKFQNDEKDKNISCEVVQGKAVVDIKKVDKFKPFDLMLCSQNEGDTTIKVDSSKQLNEERIPTPAMVRAEKAMETDSIPDCGKIAKDYPSERILEMMLKKAIAICEQNPDSVKFKQFEEYFDVNEIREIKEKYNEEQNTKAQLDSLKKEVENKLNEVWKTSCSLETVTALEKAYNALKACDGKESGIQFTNPSWKNTQVRVNVVIEKQKQFFYAFPKDVNKNSGAKEKLDGLKNYKSCFSNDQWGIITKANHNTSTFKNVLNTVQAEKKKITYEYIDDKTEIIN